MIIKALNLTVFSRYYAEVRGPALSMRNSLLWPLSGLCEFLITGYIIRKKKKRLCYMQCCCHPPHQPNQKPPHICFPSSLLPFFFHRRFPAFMKQAAYWDMTFRSDYCAKVWKETSFTESYHHRRCHLFGRATRVSANSALF